MTTQAILNPLPFFVGLDGKPLSGGYVYFGQPNQDPRQFPDTVYYDQALTIVADQPLRTTSGFIRRNGGAALVWLDGGVHSMMVLDANGRQVQYVPSFLGVLPATVQQTNNVDVFSGTGATATYTLSVIPVSKDDTEVFVSGVYQKKSTYSVSGDQLTINAPAGAGNIEVNTVLRLDFPSLSADLSASAAAAAASASAAATSATNSEASRDAIDNRIYPGTYASDPTTRPDGSAIQAGDVYFTTGNVPKVYGAGVWAQITGASAADLANSTDVTKGAALVGWDSSTVAVHLRDRLFRRVADVAALRATDKTKYSGARITSFTADTGAAATEYLYDATDTTTAESLPYVVVGTDGGRWKMVSPMEPAVQDSLPACQITNDQGDRYARRLPRQVGLAADLSQVNIELPLHIGTRRNLQQRTEDLSHITYQATNATKQTDTVTVDGITLTRLTSSNFFGSLTTNWSGLGLTPFVAGERYLLSYYVLNKGSQDNFFWMRSLANGGSPGHGAKLAPQGCVRRVWEVAHGLSASLITHIATPTATLGTEGADGYWFFTGSTDTGSIDLYIGGFMIEKLASNTYKNGIAIIGDSTMEGATGATDLGTAREVSTWLGALLNVNVFNRANGGEATNTMDARWATDITPLAVNSKYVIIQGGINDINASRTLADIQTSVGSMVTKAIADGLIPILFTCTPFAAAAADAAKEAVRLSLNSWMKATYPRVIDIAAVVADPHNPSQLRRAKNWYGDGTHYGSAAKRAVAAYVAQWNGWDFTNPSPYQPIPVATYTPPGSALTHNGLQVVGARDTGWTAGTGTALKGAFDTATATTTQAAQRILAIEQALRTHGLIN